jgi:hypothetical protein
VQSSHRHASRRRLEVRRSEAEFVAAKEQYDSLRTQLKKALNEWDGQQQELQQMCLARLDKGLSIITQKAHEAVSTAVQETRIGWHDAPMKMKQVRYCFAPLEFA